jgi:RimJ/RimL family protein N-acetyltransferase
MTSEITLRRLTDLDKSFWCMELLPGTTAQDFEKILKDSILLEQQDKSYSFIIEATGNPVGYVQVFNVQRYPADSGMIEISISNSKRMSGYAKKGIQLLEDFCFEDLGLMRLIAPISPENTGSIALFSSLGYQKYFTDPSAFFFNKKPAAHEIWVKINPG